MKRLLAGLLVGILVGCASAGKPKIDWQTRLGIHTYDQTVTELGPPDLESKLTDGTRVAEWFAGARGGMSLSLGLGGYSRHSGVGVGQELGNWGGGREFLRLTFGPDGVLRSASRVRR